MIIWPAIEVLLGMFRVRKWPTNLSHHFGDAHRSLFSVILSFSVALALVKQSPTDNDK